MSNPYAAPDAAPIAAAIPVHTPHYSARVQQVPVFAILMMVHGGMVLLMGLGIAMMAIVVPLSMMADAGQGMDAEQETVLRYMTVGYGITAGIVGLLGITQLWAGWKAFHFRRRTLVFVGIGAALCSALTCYCSFTGIPLGVWGLILLLHPDVRYAFELGQQGGERERIVAHFSYQVPMHATLQHTAPTPPPNPAGPPDSTDSSLPPS